MHFLHLLAAFRPARRTPTPPTAILLPTLQISRDRWVLPLRSGSSEQKTFEDDPLSGLSLYFVVQNKWWAPSWTLPSGLKNLRKTKAHFWQKALCEAENKEIIRKAKPNIWICSSLALKHVDRRLNLQTPMSHLWLWQSLTPTSLVFF